MRKTAILLLMVFSLATVVMLCAGKKESDCLQVDIMLVADFSGSVIGYEGFVQDAFISFVNQFELSEETVKVGVVTFNSSAYLHCPISSDKPHIIDRIENFHAATGNTNMLDAIQISVQELLNNGRPGYKKIIVLVSDGMPDDRAQVQSACEQMNVFGLNVYGILIESFGHDEEFMNSISTHYLKSDYESLSVEIKKLDICL